ncbi:MAG: hypothetical protein JXR97_06965 [Planctomycetes bacterium]|nr:hypothetical protein [Planctomycetota bacterium]
MFDLPKDSGKLKLDLFCFGARVEANCFLNEDARMIKRTRGGLGSGLDAILPGDVWVNIPVEEPFTKKSPYWIDKVSGKYSLWRDTKKICDLKLPSKADWYDEKTSSGKLVSDIGVMQGTYFALYPSELCGFWDRKPKQNCRFCSIGLCYGKTESEEKSIADVVEAVKSARRHEKITFVHFNTGFYEDHSAIDSILPYVEAVKNETGLLVGVQCPPSPDLHKYDLLKKAGVDHVSFCFEIFDPDRFVEVCPGKADTFGEIAERLGDDAYLLKVRDLAAKFLCNVDPHPGQLIFYRALVYCAELWGRGPVAGEIIAGLESPECSMAAIDFLAECGAVATVCVFRPCIGTDLECENPPKAEAIAPVLARQWEAVVKKSIPVGIAPNIKTAMVHLQQESACFSDGSKGFIYNAKCSALKALYRPICALKRR